MTCSAPDGAEVCGREALVRYGLRPPIAQERLKLLPSGLVRIELRRPFGDGTVAVDMDPLSLVCRLAAAVPPPRFNTVRYGGVLAPAAQWRALVTKPAGVHRLLRHLGEPTDTPPLAPARDPPFYRSPVLRRRTHQPSPPRQVEMFGLGP